MPRSSARHGWLFVLAIVLAGGAASCGGGGNATGTHPDAGPVCKPIAASETTCSGGVDDDCDGYADCLDTDCDGQPCGNGSSGLTCSGGACRAPCPPGVSCVPDLPTIQNVRVTTRGDTAIIDFEPVAGAADYRIYPEPDPADWLIGSNGEVGVHNGIYRCAGDRVFQPREDDDANLFD